METTDCTVEIFFSDLKPEAQKELLRFFDIEKAEDANWDTFSLFVLVDYDKAERIGAGLAEEANENNATYLETYGRMK